MGEPIVAVLRWVLKAAFFIAVALSFVGMIGILTSYLIIGFDLGLLSEVFAVVQMWLPFNLNILTAWIAITATGYLAYLVATRVFDMINAYAG